MTEAVERWLAECTDGRVSSHTITMLNSFSRWQEAAQAPQASTEAAWCDDTLPCARYTEALRARDEKIAELEALLTEVRDSLKVVSKTLSSVGLAIPAWITRDASHSIDAALKEKNDDA